MPIDIDGLSLEELVQLNHRVVERIKMLQAMQAHVDMMAFNLGARVSFDTQDGRKWRVSPGLLSPVNDVDVRAGHARKADNKKRLR